ncbi:MAG: DUF3016 domain-containing protein [Verrucomicrobiae bacterium]|nr:DUF3016 domain-containing protein [Verrucomicrobiae bacterium]
MKKLSLLLLFSSLLVSSLAAQVEVTFQNPEKYRDIEYGEGRVERGIKIYLPMLEKFITQQAKRYLEDGQHLSIVFSDIDLAGEYEPWRRIEYQDIRIVKSIYPPLMVFNYELTDSDGNVIKSGEERLLDLTFEYRPRISFHDDLFYEKEMLKDWFHTLKRKSD